MRDSGTPQYPKNIKIMSSSEINVILHLRIKAIQVQGLLLVLSKVIFLNPVTPGLYDQR